MRLPDPAVNWPRSLAVLAAAMATAGGLTFLAASAVKGHPAAAPATTPAAAASSTPRHHHSRELRAGVPAPPPPASTAAAVTGRGTAVPVEPVPGPVPRTRRPSPHATTPATPPTTTAPPSSPPPTTAPPTSPAPTPTGSPVVAKMVAIQARPVEYSGVQKRRHPAPLYPAERGWMIQTRTRNA